MNSPFKHRAISGSRKRANSHRGRVRGYIVRPEEILLLIRDTYKEAPVPVDAQFWGLGIDANENLVRFYFSSVLAGNFLHCVQLRPDILLKLLTAQSNGALPRDAELVGISVHDNFTLVRLDVRSGKFRESPLDTMPLIQLRYQDDRSLLIIDQSKSSLQPLTA